MSKNGTSISTSAMRLMPEIEEVEPLQGRLAAIGLQAAGVARDVSLDGGAAPARRQHHALGETLEVDRVAAGALDAEEQVHRAFEQVGEDHRSLRERRGRAEE